MKNNNKKIDLKPIKWNALIMVRNDTFLLIDLISKGMKKLSSDFE